jgi:hypothetical protein
MARVLWNPNIDVDETVNEFMAAYYGRAARVMRAYFDLQHRQVRPPPEGQGHHMWIYTRPGAPYLSPDFLAQGTKLLEEAQSTAADEATRKRVQKARLSIDYVKLMHAKAFIVRDGWYAPENLDHLKENFRALLKDARSFGITEFHEGRRLEEDETEFAKYVRPYRVATLENSTLRVMVAPELSGRIISIIDKATRTDVVHRPDPGEHLYPDLSGLGVFVFADYILGKPYDAVWELDAQPGPLEIHLAGTCPNGLKMQRTIRLLTDQPAVQTETTVENTGSSATDAVLNSKCDLAPEHPQELEVIFRSQEGRAVEEVTFPPDEEPSGSQWYTDSEQPDGEWTLKGVGTQMAVVNRFPKDQVTRCSLSWTGKADSRVTMALWSAKRTLAPGEILKLEADYGISRSKS